MDQRKPARGYLRGVWSGTIVIYGGEQMVELDFWVNLYRGK